MGGKGKKELRDYQILLTTSRFCQEPRNKNPKTAGLTQSRGEEAKEEKPSYLAVPTLFTWWCWWNRSQAVGRLITYSLTVELIYNTVKEESWLALRCYDNTMNKEFGEERAY